MATQKKKTKEQRRARRKVLEKKSTKELRDLVVAAVRRDRDYLVVENEKLHRENLELKVRIGELEAVLYPIVRQTLRFSIAMRGARPDQSVKFDHRIGDLRRMKEILANNGAHKKKDWPDFSATARHTIEDLGKSLLSIDVLAYEMEVAFEAGYEQRRAIELGRMNGEKDDHD